MKCGRINIAFTLILVTLLICILVIINVISLYHEKEHQQQQKDQINGIESIRLKLVDQQCGKQSKACDINSKPRTSIFYIKIHKTASTAIRSTFLTYGRTYNLTTCMDATDLWGLNWPYKIDNVRLTKLHDDKCDIVAEELVYDKQKVKQIMKDDVFVMASVRHPVQHFLSLYKYTRVHNIVEKLYGSKLKQFDGMRMMLRNPDIVQNAIASLPEEEMRDKLQINLVRSNLQLFSLGVTKYDITTIIERTKEIDFFAVAEHYDESMVILRDKLCCNIEDVLYRKQNIRRTSSERNGVIPEDLRNAILEFNKGDLILYLIAIQRLRCDIKNHTYMEQALGILRFELKKYEKKCMDIPEDQRHEICPPTTNGQIGLFVESVRKEQRRKLFGKLREKFRSRENNRNNTKQN